MPDSSQPLLADVFAAHVIGDVAVVCAATPQLNGWRYLSFATVTAAAGATITLPTEHLEVAVVPLNGRFDVATGDQQWTMSRSDVFAEPGTVAYAPPGTTITIVAREASTIAIGGAPADPVYPARLIAGDAIRSELRGGGAALRQVGHLLSPPLDAHRLILYEVHVPRGSWSGWPPHCHDGVDGSPYLEETYYFEHQPSTGFAIHRNFREGAGLDDTFVAGHRSLVTVPAGYHTTAASPGSHMYFLNYLAGDLEHDQRRTPPCFDERYTWIDGHWDDDPMTLPTAGRS
jgi:5-deoxy-glucuronate isomerase